MKLHNDSLVPEYQQLVEGIHQYDCVAISQLGLGVYIKNKSGKEVELKPNDVTKEDMNDIVEKFVSVAIRAKQAGFDGVQLHGAHGFFLSKFISPLYNQRTDEYGGTTKRRARLLLDIIEGIHKNTDNLHISVKINSDDFTEDGLGHEESLEICKMLEDAGIDSIDISGNNATV